MSASTLVFQAMLRAGTYCTQPGQIVAGSSQGIDERSSESQPGSDMTPSITNVVATALRPMVVLVLTALSAGAAVGAVAMALVLDAEVRSAQRVAHAERARATSLEVLARNANLSAQVAKGGVRASPTAPEPATTPEFSESVPGLMRPKPQKSVPPTAASGAPFASPHSMSSSEGPLATTTNAVVQTRVQPVSVPPSTAVITPTGHESVVRGKEPLQTLRDGHRITTVPSTTTKATTSYRGAGALIPAQRPASMISPPQGAPPIPKGERSQAVQPTQALPRELPVAAQAANDGGVRQMRLILLPAAELGVARIEVDEVVMLSGSRVRVGETFESGEMLLQVDPPRNRILTSQRHLVLL